MFVSDAYEGAISDRQITEDSGFLDYIEEGDVICADRGFGSGVSDLLIEKGAKLITPPFMRGKKSLSLSEEGQTKLISQARIHIERWNQRLKIFQWLKGPIPQKRLNLLSQGVFVCACLANCSRILVNS